MLSGDQNLPPVARSDQRAVMTPHQSQKLDALIDELLAFPCQELITEVSQFLSPGATDDASQARRRQYVGASYAIGKVLSYLDALRSVESERESLGRRIDLQGRAATALLPTGARWMD